MKDFNKRPKSEFLSFLTFGTTKTKRGIRKIAQLPVVIMNIEDAIKSLKANLEMCQHSDKPISDCRICDLLNKEIHQFTEAMKDGHEVVEAKG